MHPTRRAKLQSVIQEELAELVLREVKDPRISPLIFTAVEVSPNAVQAIIFISLLGESVSNPVRMKRCLSGLASASGFFRHHLAKVLHIRHVPSLIFKEDKGIENSKRVHDLLKKLSDSSPQSS